VLATPALLSQLQEAAKTTGPRKTRRNQHLVFPAVDPSQALRAPTTGGTCERGHFLIQITPIDSCCLSTKIRGAAHRCARSARTVTYGECDEDQPARNHPWSCCVHPTSDGPHRSSVLRELTQGSECTYHAQSPKCSAQDVRHGRSWDFLRARSRMSY